MGRPSFEITPEVCAKAEELASKGFTLAEIAKGLGVHYDTLNEKRKEFSEFSDAIEGGKRLAGSFLANKLFERGKGCSHIEEKVFIYNGEIIRTEITKYYPPETTAIMHWLTNRDPENWKNKQAHEHSGFIENNGGVSRANQILEGFTIQRSGNTDEGTLQG